MTAKQKKNQKKIQKSRHLVVVGIGASAGGLEALRTLFSKFNEEGAASFVIVQHMSPTSKSMLAELIGRETKLNVHEAKDGDELQQGHVYVTPPNVDILIENHRLRLTDLENRIGPKPSIDRFLISLADQYGENAIACILSGTGGDGAQGIKAIKAAGGVTIAQTPESSKYDGMPRAAIATGAVDLTLEPADIARELKVISRRLSVDEVGIEEKFPDEPYKGIIDLLHQRINVDFSLYKPKTIGRRLNRRMGAVKAKSLEEYYQYLKQDPEEALKLFNGILISVTSFFRDMQQFEALKKYFIDYLQQEKNRDSVRIWSAGCATGEEPFSLAILALEACNGMDMGTKKLPIQVFATDIGEKVMADARKGFFRDSSMDCIDPDLLRKYFNRADGGYLIKKEVRELVLFARHDLTVDPPFLKMDLISCRNVFIYFEQDIQEKILKTFHYALKPKGLLFLGKSESVGGQKSFFRPLDATTKIFQRTDRAPDPSISFTTLRATDNQSNSFAFKPNRKDQARVERDMIRSFCPNAIVLDYDLRVQAVYGEAKNYLTFPDGPLEHKLEKLLLPELKNSLMTLIHRCRRSHSVSKMSPIGLELDGKKQYLEAAAYSLDGFGDSKFIVNLSTVDVDQKSLKNPPSPRSEEFAELERELIATREHLQTVIEEQETSNEELQALNEELQSANEELQSTNEELETSNEELQSSNEELTTLNEELNVKTAELAELSTHLQIVQNAVRSPVIVIDSNFNLTRFNDNAADLLQLNRSNLRKNFRLVNARFDLSPVFKLLEECLKSKKTLTGSYSQLGYEFEVYCQAISDEHGGEYGAVLTLIDNTELRAAFKRVENSESILFKILEGIPAKVSVKDIVGNYTFVNTTFCKLLGLELEEIIGKSDNELFGPEAGAERRRKDFQVLNSRTIMYTDEVHRTKDGTEKIFHTARVPLINEQGEIKSICSVGIDISGRAHKERKLMEFQHAIASAEDCFAMIEFEDDRFVVSFGSETLCRLCEFGIEEIEGKSIYDVLRCIAPTLPRVDIENYEKRIQEQNRCAFQFRGGKKGEERYFDLRSYKLPDDGKFKIFLTIFDVTDEKISELNAKQREEEYMRAGRLASLGEMAAGIAHELKTPLNTIQGYIDLIKEYNEQGIEIAEPVQESIAHIESTVTNISDIIVGLKSISRTNGDEGFVACSVKAIVDDVTKICSFHIKNRGVDLDVNVECPDAKLMAKPTQIVQVLINLVNNAVDAVGGQVDAWVKLDVKEFGQDIEFRVIDSGKGIPIAVAKQIMTPFFTTKQTGTGLGLSLSRNIAKIHKGSLDLDTSAKNTSFVMRLPKERS